MTRAALEVAGVSAGGSNGLMEKHGRGSPPRVVVRSIAFTPAALEALEELATNIAAHTGRKSNASAVVRALLRHTQEIPELTAKLALLVDDEQTNDFVWGKLPRSR